MTNLKTEAIFFSSLYYRRRIATDSIQVGTDSIKPSSCIKLLGVSLDTNLNMQLHIKEKCLVASRNLNMIRRIRKHLTTESCRLLVQSLVISHLDYCNAVFAGLPTSSLLPMQSIQNQAAKVVLQKRKFDSASSCLKELHWLPIVKRIQFKVLCLVYKCIHNHAPAYLKQLIQFRKSTYNTRSSCNPPLSLPRTHTSFGSRAFCSIGPKLWNDLPDSVKSNSSFTSFKRNLKTHLFKLAFN